MKQRRPTFDYAMPAYDGGVMGVFLPSPCKPEDIEIIRKWLDLFEPVLTGKDEATADAKENA